MPRDRCLLYQQSAATSHHGARPRRRVPSGVRVRCTSDRAGRSPGPCRLVLLLLVLAAISCCCCSLLSSQRRRGVAREAAKPSVAVLALVRDVDAAVEQREPLGVVSASPGVCLIDARCTTAAVRPRQPKLENFFAASVLLPLARSGALARFLRCAAQSRLQNGG